MSSVKMAVKARLSLRKKEKQEKEEGEGHFEGAVT